MQVLLLACSVTVERKSLADRRRQGPLEERTPMGAVDSWLGITWVRYDLCF